MARLGSPRASQRGRTAWRRFSGAHSATHCCWPCRRPVETKLDDSLAGLVESELLYRRGLAPEVIFEFKHALG